MGWMIYGANGYTGELIAREAKSRGRTPVLAGRSASKVTALAKELRLSPKVFALEFASRNRGGVARHPPRIKLRGAFFKNSRPIDAGVPECQD